MAQKLCYILDFISPICVRCHNNPESHLHLFRDCWESPIIWNYIFQRVNFASTIDLTKFFNTNWRNWLSYNLSQAHNWKSLFSIAIWHIWIARNKVVFDLKMTKPFSIYNTLFMDHSSTSHILQGKGKEVSNGSKPTWFPPSFDYLKLNVDGSWKEQNEA